MKRAIYNLCLFAVLCCLPERAAAQSWFQMHVSYDGYHWAFPYEMDHVSYFDFEDETLLRAHQIDDEAKYIPFRLTPEGKYAATVDSITMTDELTEWGKNKYRVFAIHVTTDDGAEIDSKEEYVPCYVSVDGLGEYPDLSMSARIRGRGNSTWLWYDKKPYRIKFDASTKLLGIKKNKDWVLLANYRDMTDMMNVFGSLTAKWLGTPYTTPVRFAELFINGQYNGVYQVAEQVEVGGNRVKIDEAEGVLLTLDVDDGPSNSPDEGNNFYTEVYRMPMAVKHPKPVSAEQLAQIKTDFAVLENAIKTHDYAAVDALMDIPSYIAMLQLQEYLYNVELAAPRSIFLFRDKDGKYTFGPAWDWDAGFDFDWSDMTTGHTFFKDYTETLFGTNPYKQNGNYHVSKFFTDMFGNAQFVEQYKARWAEVSDSIFTSNWAETKKYIDGLGELQISKTATGTGYTTPQLREEKRWPVSRFSPVTETQKLEQWLKNRLAYLTPIIANYPVPGETQTLTVVGTIEKAYQLSEAGGYTQSVKVKVDKSEVANLLGVSASTLSAATLELVPLDADGQEGSNTAAGKYGAWFDADGNTTDFNSGDPHVYLESNDLFSWSCGCHPYNCYGDDVHTVRMQYRHAASKQAVNVAVTFTVVSDGWWW